MRFARDDRAVRAASPGTPAGISTATTLFILWATSPNTASPSASTPASIARRVIIAMEHTTKTGDSKILPQCTLPLTGQGVVDLIVTELAVIEVTGRGLVLREIAEGTTEAAVRAATAAPLVTDGPVGRF